MKVEFRDGTDFGTWEHVFQPLVGWVLKIRAFVGIGQPFSGDVVFRSFGDDENGMGGFWFSLWSDELDGGVEEQFFVRLDNLHEVSIY